MLGNGKGLTSEFLLTSIAEVSLLAALRPLAVTATSLERLNDVTKLSDGVSREHELRGLRGHGVPKRRLASAEVGTAPVRERHDEMDLAVVLVPPVDR